MDGNAVRAHWDGERIRLDEPCDLAPGTELLVTVLPPPDQQERDAWLALSQKGLEGAYCEDEPDDSTAPLKERNPGYEPR